MKFKIINGLQFQEFVTLISIYYYVIQNCSSVLFLDLSGIRYREKGELVTKLHNSCLLLI